MKNDGEGRRSLTVIKWLTFFMFMMFAMTTDSVGVIIPEVIKEFHLSMTVAGAFHYATMAGIAFAGIFLGYLADKLGRKKTIILGLVLFALNSYLFSVGKSFQFFLVLLVISGTAIGIFKTGALALIGDITRSTTEHTATMNTVEGFFAVGAIIGPAIVARLLAAGTSWKWLYVIAGTICVVLIVTASFVRYPHTTRAAEQPIDLKRTLRHDEKPLCPRFFGGDISLRSGRMRRLCLDAHPPCHLSWLRNLHGDLCNIDFLRPSGGRQIHRIMDTRPPKLDRRGNHFQPGDFCLLHGQHGRRNRNRGIPPAILGTLHVRHLSHDQLQGHKLLPKDRAWRRAGRDSIFHLRGGRPRAIGYGCDQ